MSSRQAREELISEGVQHVFSLLDQFCKVFWRIILVSLLLGTYRQKGEELEKTSSVTIFSVSGKRSSYIKCIVWIVRKH
jgi:hypothetical protein